ncbi:hypothetical protein L2E82_47174 [Cichorium intybus]|uniref:Uncharacterized protein n=1 Tax=Cichorium intybus TaxID=13427 RepID=A0ACB8YVG8_CICIN|nr:hypothetical protein L2E82_47174 [Cichorium intybus]
MRLKREKGLDVETVGKIGKYVCLKDHPLKLLSELKKEGSVFLKNDSSNQALKDLERLFKMPGQTMRMFGTKHVAAVGVSLGIERIFTIMEELQKAASQSLWRIKRLNKHFDHAKEFGIPWMVIVGEREIND